MDASDVALFDDLDGNEQVLVRAIMRAFVAPRDQARRKAMAAKNNARAHAGYVVCAWCGQENDCYNKEGKPRCAACKREQET